MIEGTLTRLLAAVASGIPLSRAIGEASRIEPDRGVARQLKAVHNALELGAGPEEALQRARGELRELLGEAFRAEALGTTVDYLSFKVKARLRDLRARLRGELHAITLLAEAYIALLVGLLAAFVAVVCLSPLGSPIPLPTLSQLELLALIGAPASSAIMLLALEAVARGEAVNWGMLDASLATLAIPSAWLVGARSWSQGLAPPIELAWLLTLSLLPPGVVYAVAGRRLRRAGDESVALLRAVVEGVRSGLPPLHALEAACERARAIGGLFRAALNRFKLGSSVEGELKEAGLKAGHPDAKAAAMMLASLCSVGEVALPAVEEAVEALGELYEYRRLRRAEAKPYLLVAYVAVAVFVGAALVIVELLLAPIASMAGMLGLPTLPVGYVKLLLAWMAVTASLGSGLFAGKAAYGSAREGLIHGALMSLACLAAFRVL